MTEVVIWFVLGDILLANGHELKIKSNKFARFLYCFLFVCFVLFRFFSFGFFGTSTNYEEENSGK